MYFYGHTLVVFSALLQYFSIDALKAYTYTHIVLGLAITLTLTLTCKQTSGRKLLMFKQWLYLLKSEL